MAQVLFLCPGSCSPALSAPVCRGGRLVRSCGPPLTGNAVEGCGARVTSARVRGPGLPKLRPRGRLNGPLLTGRRRRRWEVPDAPGALGSAALRGPGVRAARGGSARHVLRAPARGLGQHQARVGAAAVPTPDAPGLLLRPRPPVTRRLSPLVTRLWFGARRPTAVRASPCSLRVLCASPCGWEGAWGPRACSQAPEENAALQRPRSRLPPVLGGAAVCGPRSPSPLQVRHTFTSWCSPWRQPRFRQGA